MKIDIAKLDGRREAVETMTGALKTGAQVRDRGTFAAREEKSGGKDPMTGLSFGEPFAASGGKDPVNFSTAFNAPFVATGGKDPT